MTWKPMRLRVSRWGSATHIRKAATSVAYWSTVCGAPSVYSTCPSLSGFGMGLLFVRGLSTGGTDLLSLLLANRIHDVPVGTILLCVDGAVVVIAVLIFRDIDVALYSAISIFVASKVVDNMVQGADYAKVIYVVTGRGQELADLLSDATGRGVTMSPAVGSYSGQNKTLLTTVVRRGGVSIALAIIKEHDPTAFVYVVSSIEVHGEGFKAIK